MGGIVSAVAGGIEREDESIWEKRRELLAEKLAFFRRWHVEHAEYVMEQYRELGRFEPSNAVSVAALSDLSATASLSSSSATKSRKRPGTELGELQPHEFKHVRTTWQEFFGIVLQAEEKRKRSTREQKRWHPATRGYAMVTQGGSSLDRSSLDSSVEDTHTDDEESEDESEGEGDDDKTEQDDEDDEEDEDGSSTGGGSPEWESATPTGQTSLTTRAMPTAFDPELISPVFFGYTDKTDADVEEEREEERAEQEDEEQRVMDKQRQRRHQLLERTKDETVKRREARERKLQGIIDEHETARVQRKLELDTAKKVMSAQDFAPVERQWQTDESVIMQAQASELVEKKQRFAYKNREDLQKLHGVEDVVWHADAVESSKNPHGAELEKLARAEVRRITAEVDRTTEELEEAQKELLAGQQELGETKKAAQKALKSSLILLEGRVTTTNKELEALMQELDEAEFMLKRAERIRAQEDSILPIFQPLAHEDADDSAHVLNAPVFPVLAVLGIAADDVMWDKLAYLIRLFDVNDNKFLDKDEICELMATLAAVLTSLGMVEVLTSAEEIESVVLRAFMIGNLDPTKGMTVFELKSWLASMAARSLKLSELFGADWSFAQMSTIMRYSMGMVHQFELGMNSVVDLKYKVAREMIKYKPCLHREQKQVIHDRAVAMGDDDPLKPDYSRFLRTTRKSMFSDAVPLRHGHLENYSHWRDEVSLKTVTKLQNIFRGRLARRAAEKLAKKQAFMQAKDKALQDCRDRITAEYNKRETESGVGRMKWDAKVRMKQAKLKAAGDNRNRAGVIEAMIEESVASAQDGVASRFDEIAKERGFIVEDEGKEDAEEKLEKVEDEFEKLAEVSREAGRQAKDAQKKILMELIKTDLNKIKEKVRGKEVVLSLGKPGTPRKGEDGDSAIGAPSSGSTLSPSRMVKPDSAALDLDSVGVDMAGGGSSKGAIEVRVNMRDMRKALMQLGLFPPELYTVGETIEERELRQQLRDSDPPKEDLITRLRGWDTVLTKLKTEELLAEFPSKRLLMKYVQGFIRRADPPGNLQPLVEDLTLHFQIIRGADRICSILVNLLNSDFEFGTVLHSIQILQAKQDIMLKKLAQGEVEKGMSEAEEEHQRRCNIASVQGKSPEEVAESQRHRDEAEVHKRLQSIAEAKTALSKYHKRLSTAEHELKELRRKQKNQTAFKERLEGREYNAEIEPDHRYDWAKRYSLAMAAPEETDEDLQVKYSEIIVVCREFLETAKHAAVTVVDELHLPPEDKSIRPVLEKACHGRGYEGDRGASGQRLKFEAFNIRLKVCTDDHGMFNGDHECAAKGLGGRERLGALEYMKLHQPGVVIPLTCLVDYHGFRVLAVAKAPIQKLLFASTGKLRRAKEELVHGTLDGGEKIKSDSRILSSRLQEVARKLNLTQHLVKGSHELNSKSLWASADLRGYKGPDGNFYLLNFWRAFPSEDPAATPHLRPAARGQSVLWRGLRPELVRKNQVALSPDANLLVTHGAPDWLKQTDDVFAATERLVQEVVPKFAEELCQRDLSGKDVSSGFGLDLTGDMHRRGVGVRHMGLLRDMFWRPMQGVVDIAYNSTHVRTRQDMRKQLHKGDQVRIDGEVYRISSKPKHEHSATALTLDRKVALMSKNNVPIYKGRVASDDNCDKLRLVLLAEMVARAAKNMLRHYLRTVANHNRASAKQTQVMMTVDFLNIITGSHEHTEDFWRDQLTQNVRDRFGEVAVDEGEENNLRLMLTPALVFIVHRLQDMLGISLTNGCVSHLCDHPDGFRFTPLDITHSPIRAKHSMPMLEFAEASMLSLQAGKMRATGYVPLVQRHEPELYLTLQERKGSKVAVNHGKGGLSLSGYYTEGIKFERPGAIADDPLNRAVELQPQKRCRIETKHTGKVLAPMQTHLPFTIEAWAKCEGGVDTNRVVLMTGRYSLVATRENTWAMTISTSDAVELLIPGSPVVHGKWTHVVGTYDGTVLRLYVDSELAAQIEEEPAVERKTAEKLAEREKALKSLANEETQARERCKVSTAEEAETFLKTKEGKVKLNKAAQKVVGKAEVALRTDKDAAAKGIKKPTKAEAKAQAKMDITTEMYMRNVQQIAHEYKRRRDELDDLAAQERDEVLERAEKPLRVGATCRSKRSKDGTNFFSGQLCHVAVYLSALSPDAVHSHYLAGALGTTAEADRLYALAGSRFRAALAFAPDDREILARYAQSIVSYLEMESMQLNSNMKKSQQKVEEAVDTFIQMENWDGLAEIMRQLPSAPIFGHAFCRAFKTTVAHVPDYYSTSTYLPLDKLAHLPRKFYLDLPGVDEEMTEVAAAVYRLVLSELSLADIFGDTDLSWLPNIKSSPTVVAMVMQAESDDDERVIDLEKFHLDCSDLEDQDVRVMVDNRRLTVVLNLSGCERITDSSLEYAGRFLVHLQALNLSNCRNITDQALHRVVARNSRISTLGLSRCLSLSDTMLSNVPAVLPALRTVDLSHSPNVTDEVVSNLAKQCRHLESLYLQYCVYVSDSGIQVLAVEANTAALTTLDLSGCALVSDDSIASLGRRLTKLRSLNLKSVNRVTDTGAASITHNCWGLEYLCLEDAYNVQDSTFVHNFAVDGRRAVDEKMLAKVTELNLRDCCRITDVAVNQVMKRASPTLTMLDLSGCSLLTDQACAHLVEDPMTGVRRGRALTDLRLGYCLKLTDVGMGHLARSLDGLKSISLAGCIQLTDEGLLTLVSACARLQDLVLSQCKLLTDKGMCHLADYLWVEDLDVSHCSRLTDDGVEVLAMEFTGLRKLGLSRCPRLTERTLEVLARYCPQLKDLGLAEVPHVGAAAVERLKASNRGLVVGMES